MDRRSTTEGVYLDRKHLFGHDAPGAWWLPPDSWSPFQIDTGDNSAGNGGNGYFAGGLINGSYAGFEPLNFARGGSHATADAHQTNIVYLDQSAHQIAGVAGIERTMTLTAFRAYSKKDLEQAWDIGVE